MEEQIQKFNSGEQVLLRINELWKKVHEKIEENKYYAWDIMLDRIWCELTNLMNDAEYELYSPQIAVVSEELKKNGPIIDDLGAITMGFKSITPEYRKKRDLQYNSLIRKEQKLRLIQAKVEKKVVSDEVKEKKESWD